MNILNTIAKLLGNDICPKYNKPCINLYEYYAGNRLKTYTCVGTAKCQRELYDNQKAQQLAKIAESRKILGIK